MTQNDTLELECANCQIEFLADEACWADDEYGNPTAHCPECGSSDILPKNR